MSEIGGIDSNVAVERARVQLNTDTKTYDTSSEAVADFGKQKSSGTDEIQLSKTDVKTVTENLEKATSNVQSLTKAIGDMTSHLEGLTAEYNVANTNGDKDASKIKSELDKARTELEAKKVELEQAKNNEATSKSDKQTAEMTLQKLECKLQGIEKQLAQTEKTNSTDKTTMDASQVNLTQVEQKALEEAKTAEEAKKAEEAMAKFEGYDEEKAQQLADEISSKFGNVEKGTGWCAQKVRQAMEAVGLKEEDGVVADAKDFTEKILSKSDKFKKLDTDGWTAKDLQDFAEKYPGAVIAWQATGEKDGNGNLTDRGKYGHIGITDGKGNQISDFSGKIPDVNSKFEVYLPYDGSKTKGTGTDDKVGDGSSDSGTQRIDYKPETGKDMRVNVYSGNITGAIDRASHDNKDAAKYVQKQIDEGNITQEEVNMLKKSMTEQTSKGFYTKTSVHMNERFADYVGENNKTGDVNSKTTKWGGSLQSNFLYMDKNKDGNIELSELDNEISKTRQEISDMESKGRGQTSLNKYSLANKKLAGLQSLRNEVAGNGSSHINITNEGGLKEAMLKGKGVNLSDFYR